MNYVNSVKMFESSPTEDIYAKSDVGKSSYPRIRKKHDVLLLISIIRRAYINSSFLEWLLVEVKNIERPRPTIICRVILGVMAPSTPNICLLERTKWDVHEPCKNSQSQSVIITLESMYGKCYSQ
jgi:hypothetical protein